MNVGRLRVFLWPVTKRIIKKHLFHLYLFRQQLTLFYYFISWNYHRPPPGVSIYIKMIHYFVFSAHTHTETKKELCQTQKKITVVSFFFFLFFLGPFQLSLPDFFLFVCLNVWAWLPKTAPPISLSTQQTNQPKKTKTKLLFIKTMMIS